MIHATVKGRGGTELKPCWDLLRNDKKFKGRIADLVMVFTDGYLTQYKRDPKSMRNLCWVIIDNPGFNLQYKDINTKRVIINSNDVK
jgi:predicted metal-dependent peptidase